MGKKKTHEEYVEELKIKNSNIEVVGKYTGANIKILHRCLIDGYEWYATPANILYGTGCPKCGKKFKRTHDEYVEELHLISSHIDVLDTFIGLKMQIKHRCNIHNVVWNVSPENLLKGCGCIECGKEKARVKTLKTHEQYVEELKNKNPNIHVLEKYNGTHIPILHRCLIDYYEWKVTPESILFNTGCPKCNKHFRRTHDEYLEEVTKTNDNIEVLEMFEGMNTPILHKCKKHNIQWKVIPGTILKGSGCVECGKEKLSNSLKKSHEQYIKELAIVNKDIVVLGKYINSNISVLHKCLIDGHEWYSTPSNILRGHGCPKCNGGYRMTPQEYIDKLYEVSPDIVSLEDFINVKTKIRHKCLICSHEWYVTPESLLSGTGCPQCHESKGERQVRQWLEKNRITYDFQYRFENCKDINPIGANLRNNFIKK